MSSLGFTKEGVRSVHHTKTKIEPGKSSTHITLEKATESKKILTIRIISMFAGIFFLTTVGLAVALGIVNNNNNDYLESSYFLECDNGIKNSNIFKELTNHTETLCESTSFGQTCGYSFNPRNKVCTLHSGPSCECESGVSSDESQTHKVKPKQICSSDMSIDVPTLDVTYTLIYNQTIDMWEALLYNKTFDTKFNTLSVKFDLQVRGSMPIYSGDASFDDNYLIFKLHNFKVTNKNPLTYSIDTIQTCIDNCLPPFTISLTCITQETFVEDIENAVVNTIEDAIDASPSPNA